MGSYSTDPSALTGSWLKSESVRIKVEPGPLSPRKGPLVFEALNEGIDLSDLELDARVVRPSIIETFQEVVEEAFLEIAAVVGVEVRPMFESMHLEPLLLGGGPDETLHVPSQVQTLPPPSFLR